MATSFTVIIKPWPAGLIAFLCMFCSARGGTATWSQMPFGSVWNNSGHWNPTTVPNGPADDAIFNTSDYLSVYLTENTEVNEIIFSTGANAFEITAPAGLTLSLSGVGVTNNSTVAQTFVAAAMNGTIKFLNNASGGSNTVFRNKGGAVNGASGGLIEFFGNAAAGSGSFINENGTEPNTQGAVLSFFDNATAGTGTFSTVGPPHFGSTGSPPPEAASQITFFNSSSAANGSFTNGTGYIGSGRTTFADTSSAGNGTFVNQGGAGVNFRGGMTVFANNSSAENSTLTNTAASEFNAAPGVTMFMDASSAASATLVNNANNYSDATGRTLFMGSSSADTATLIANTYVTGSGSNTGGTIRFSETSTGNTARVEVFGAGNLDISAHNAPGVAIGSIEGNGIVFLGSNNLSVGSNNRNTSFVGVIQDGGVSGGRLGSLTKAGAGTLSLGSANTYPGGTTLDGGQIEALHDGALGAGDVSLTAPGVVLTLGSPMARRARAEVSQAAGTSNFIYDGARLSVVTGASVNLNYTGNPEVIGFLVIDGIAQPVGIYGSAASGAPHQLPQFNGPGTLLVTTPFAASRKMHAQFGYDLALPLSGALGVECRAAGPNNSYQILISFGLPVTFGSASVTSGTGSVANTVGNGTTTVTLNLTGVTDVQRLTVTLFGANYGSGGGDLPVSFAVLAGDTNGDGRVNVGDTNQTKSSSGEAAGTSDFPFFLDVNLDGRINVGDANFVKARSGHSLP